MPPFLGLLLVYLPAALAGSFLISRGRDFAFRGATVAVFLMVFAGLIAIVSSTLPFGDGGDDLLYFYSTQFSRGSGGLFDTTRFVGSIEQPGYPILLSFVSIVSGGSLLTYKLSNLVLLTLTAAAWGRIGSVIASPTFGRALLIAILVATPLWYYSFFLLKDMSIVFLQSLFLLGLVEAYSRSSWKPWALVAAATLALILFRTPLVVQNALVAIGAMTLGTLGRGGSRRQVMPLLLAGGLFLGIMVVVTNPDLLSSLGVAGQARVIGSEEMYRQTEQYREQSSMSGALFPIIYLVTETAGLTPETWTGLTQGGLSAIGPAGLRGLLAIPWILFVLPFFALGIRWIFSVPPTARRPRTLIEALLMSRFLVTPWGAILLFILSSMAISWIVGDTTRWRVPDLPAFLAIAVAGFFSASPQLRMAVLIGWGLAVVGAAAAFYSLLQ